MTKKLVGLAAAFGLLAACQGQNSALFAPKGSATASATAPGVDSRGQDIDPMLVGQRLMTAGEYELAIKSFLRAAGDQGFTAPVLASLGTANLGLGRLGQAEAILRRAVSVDENYVPVWNNLGVVLLEKASWAEAARVFQTAFALDSGSSVEIQQNLRLALAKRDQTVYSVPEETDFALVRRGTGDYLLMSTQE